MSKSYVNEFGVRVIDPRSHAMVNPKTANWGGKPKGPIKKLRRTKRKTRHREQWGGRA